MCIFLKRVSVLLHIYTLAVIADSIRILYLSREDSNFCKVSNNKSFSMGVQSPTEINAPRGCAVILRRICQLSLTRITHQVSRAFDLNTYYFV